MGFKTGVAVGMAVGYYFGTRAGRERYEQLERYLRPVRESEAWGQAQQLAKELAGDFAHATKRAVKDATAPERPHLRIA
jgi:hypothetical protein